MKYMYIRIVVNISILLLLSVSACSKHRQTAENDIPVAPSNLTGVAVSSSSIQLLWEDNSENESRFLIYRRNLDSFREVGETDNDMEYYLDIDLTQCSGYYYYVAAANNESISPPSNIVYISLICSNPSDSI